jgi:glycosyltransferase involved in cell wall biosynthesis
MMPRVSVGLPVYNGERYLETAIDALLRQTCTNLELIISDNASTDGTEAICRRYAQRDTRILYTRSERNRGAAWNHNRVVELARAPYFKWAAHDDICAPEFLERCADVLDRQPTVILCYPQTVLVDEAGRQIGACADRCAPTSSDPFLRFRDLMETLTLSNPMYGVIRTSVLRRTPLVGSYPASDLVLLGELALRGAFHLVSETLFFRRDHPQKSSRSNPGASALAAWYDPSKQGKIVLRNWRLLFEYLVSITRTPMGLSARARCYVYMLRWLRWNLRDLRQELHIASVTLIRRARRIDSVSGAG